MAGAKGRLLNEVRGKIENGAEHYAFVKNGKQFIGCVRKGWNTKLNDIQKINALKFAYSSTVGNMLAIATKAGETSEMKKVIGAAFRIIRHGRQAYFFDDNLFINTNAVMSRFGLDDFFTIRATLHGEGGEDDILNLWEINPAIKMDKKTGANATLTSYIYKNTPPEQLPQIYAALAEVRGSELEDTAELAEIWDGLQLLQLNFCRWCRIPVVDEISPAAQEELKKYLLYYGHTLPIYTDEATAIKALE